MADGKGQPGVSSSRDQPQWLGREPRLLGVPGKGVHAAWAPGDARTQTHAAGPRPLLSLPISQPSRRRLQEMGAAWGQGAVCPLRSAHLSSAQVLTEHLLGAPGVVPPSLEVCCGAAGRGAQRARFPRPRSRKRRSSLTRSANTWMFDAAWGRQPPSARGAGV